MSFTFGTPTPATNNTFGGFGTSQGPASTAFGAQPAAPTTGFGTSQPATGFGTQPATTNTSFGGFGATSTASTGFGATTTPSSTGFSFGAASTAPTSAPSFGGFGATLTAPTSAPSFGGFGATTSAPASTGLFGAPAASTSTFGGFGTATAAKPSFNLSTTASGGGLFGAKPATTTSFFGNTIGGFGQPQNNEALNQQRGQQVYQLLSQIEQEERAKSAPSITSEDYKPDNVWHSLALLKSWWDPKSPHCRFKYYFYNVVAPNEVQLYQKPADQDQKAWDKAQEMNPDRTKLVPALAIGFDDVQKRMDEQHKLSEAHSAKLAELEAILKNIQRKSQLEIAKKLEEYKRRHMQTAQRVIKVNIHYLNNDKMLIGMFSS
jgi:nuclear pore complex protein Nup54